MASMTATGPIEGYRMVEPAVSVEGDRATIDCLGVYYRQVNDKVRELIGAGVKTVRLVNVNGQRYIGTGLRGSDIRIEVEGTPGQDLGMFMDGPTIEVFGNAQDGVGNTMSGGTVIVHGSAGDVVGYGMRGGRVLVRGDVGYRVGIHMKAFESKRPVIICGGRARDFFGEYMAGGLLVLLGLDSAEGEPIVGGYLGTGMHGGEIYVRGPVEAWQCGKEVGVSAATDEQLGSLKPHLEEFCRAFERSLDDVLSRPFTRIVPVSHRPYGKLYTYL